MYFYLPRTFAMSSRMKDLGVELENEMDDNSLFVREIMQGLLI